MGEVKTQLPLNLDQITALTGYGASTRGIQHDEEGLKELEIPEMSEEEIEDFLKTYEFDPDYGVPEPKLHLRRMADKLEAVTRGDAKFTDEEIQLTLAALILKEVRNGQGW